MERERIQQTYSTSATRRPREVGRFTTKCARFRRLAIQSGDRYFHLYCTEDSLENRRDEVLRWADELAQQLCWRTYETTISAISAVEATERVNALFEHRFPGVGYMGNDRWDPAKGRVSGFLK